jgi:hypothetical protein
LAAKFRELGGLKLEDRRLRLGGCAAQKGDGAARIRRLGGSARKWVAKIRGLGGKIRRWTNKIMGLDGLVKR